jgi:hypothetical protein
MKVHIESPNYPTKGFQTCMYHVAMRNERNTVISLHEDFIFHRMIVAYKNYLCTKFQYDPNKAPR